MVETMICPDPECQALLERGVCPECGHEQWAHQYDACEMCDYNGPWR